MKSYMKTILNALMAWIEPKFNKLFGELATKADKLPDSELLDMMVEEGIVDPASNADNVLYADKNGKIYVL